MRLMILSAKVQLCPQGLARAGRNPACAADAWVWGLVTPEEGVLFPHSPVSW